MKSTTLGFVLAAAALAQRAPAPKAGDPAPALDLDRLLQAPGGASASWDGLRGQVVVLEFWATWCGPCVAAIPHLNELAHKFQSRPVRFLSITDEDPELVAKFLDKRPIQGWIGIDKNKVTSKAYAVTGIPHTVLVDAKGTIAAITFPEAVTPDALEEMLAGRLPKVPSHTAPAQLVDAIKNDLSAQPALAEFLIRPSEASGGSMQIGNGSYAARGTTALLALSNAYGVTPTRIVGPAWLKERHFDILLKTPRRTPDPLRTTLQQALANTFGFTVRRETRESDVLVLTTPGGPGQDLMVTASTGGSSSSSGRNTMKATNSSMASLASALESRLGKLVVNESTLEGRYDYQLSWSESEPLIEVVRKRLGIELTSARRPVELLIVEEAKP